MKYIYSFLLFVCFFNVYSQSNPTVLSNSIATGFPTVHIKDGKVIMRNDNLSETINNVELSVTRFEGTESISITVEAYFVLDNGNDEVTISPTLTFTNSDFVPSWSIASIFKSVNLTIPANVDKDGVIKVKIREKQNGGSWSSYIFGHKIYGVYLVPSNDDYTDAITLIPSVLFTDYGTTTNATRSVQLIPSCIVYPDIYDIIGDVWYKFVATDSNHVISIYNIVPIGASSVSFGIAGYSSSLNEIGCSSDSNLVMPSLTVGQTYYVRVWTSNYQYSPLKSMDFNIAVGIPQANVITSIDWDNSIDINDYLSNPSQYSDHKVAKANFIHDAAIPVADIGFDWKEVPPAASEADYFGIYLFEINDSNNVILTSTDGDVATRLAVRLKVKSTGVPISEWYTRPGLIWFN